MASLARRSQYNTNIWPGFVDALATLLMVIIFLLMIFVLAQFFLNDALSGRDQALDRLNSQISEMGDLLALERKDSDRLRNDFSLIAEELQASVILRDDLNASLRLMAEKSRAAEIDARNLNLKLDNAFATIDVNKETIASKVTELARLSSDIAALSALRDDLESQINALDLKIGGKDEELAGKDKKIAEERKLSESARAQVALANRQMAALREQMSQLSEALDIAERKAEEQNVSITSLGRRLNAALATKVHELSRYRSEFFGRLRQALGDQKGIHIVGDRFVFQSEVLFASASAVLGEKGKVQIERLAKTLVELSAKIPKDIDWILRVDGHTDRMPIKTNQFPSNWELSSSRAISVVSFLIKKGIPPNRLAAAGFGEFQPLDKRKDKISMRRNRRIELKLTQQ